MTTTETWRLSVNGAALPGWARVALSQGSKVKLMGKNTVKVEQEDEPRERTGGLAQRGVYVQKK